MAALGYRASKGTEELRKVLEQERTCSVSGFMKPSVAAGWRTEDDTARIQKRGVQGLKESPSTEVREQIPWRTAGSQSARAW